MKKMIRLLCITALAAGICVCGCELKKITGQYRQEAQLKEELSRYRPEFFETQDEQNAALEEAVVHATAPARIVNQSVSGLRDEVNDDVIGWLTIPDTRIDYPFVIAADNDYYLRRNIYKKQAKAGSIFVDCRCGGDFSDFNTVIYGHNMKNSSMFGDLKLFADPGFFASNTVGTLFTIDSVYTLNIFAYMVVRANDKLIYDPTAEREEFLAYVKKNARRYREPAETDKVVTLSTCAYEYDGARMIVLATMTPEEDG